MIGAVYEAKKEIPSLDVFLTIRTIEYFPVTNPLRISQWLIFLRRAPLDAQKVPHAADA